MAEVIEYRKRIERQERRRAIGDPVVVSMRNACDDEYKRLQAEQRDRQFMTQLASALRQIYMVHGDSVMSDLIRSAADIEARKILSCQT